MRRRKVLMKVLSELMYIVWLSVAFVKEVQFNRLVCRNEFWKKSNVTQFPSPLWVVDQKCYCLVIVRSTVDVINVLVVEFPRVLYSALTATIQAK